MTGASRICRDNLDESSLGGVYSGTDEAGGVEAEWGGLGGIGGQGSVCWTGNDLALNVKAVQVDRDDYSSSCRPA
jgi:hypothetical protein